MDLPFVKMEGAGNDYIFVDAIAHPFPLDRAPELARRWSDRHFGIGADGLILLAPGSAAPVRMVMWNADGSRGAMCGNGLRCLSLLAHEHGHVTGRRFAVETDVGMRQVELWPAAGLVAGADIELGAVRMVPEPVEVEIGGRHLRCFLADVGNPHAVVFLDQDPEHYPVVETGAALQGLPAFAGGVNVEFVQVRPDGSLLQRTFERGSGETLACGSGAAAAAAVARDRQLVPGPRVRVRVRGGELTVHFGERGLVLGGPARTVYRGVIELPAHP